MVEDLVTMISSPEEVEININSPNMKDDAEGLGIRKKSPRV